MTLLGNNLMTKQEGMKLQDHKSYTEWTQWQVLRMLAKSDSQSHLDNRLCYEFHRN